MEEIAHEIQGVDATVGVAGQSLLLNAYGSNFGTMFVTLRPFDERTTPETYYEAIANQLREPDSPRGHRRRGRRLRPAAGARRRAGPAAS